MPELLTPQTTSGRWGFSAGTGGLEMVKDRGLEDWKSKLHAVCQLGFPRLDISRYFLKHY